MYLKDSNAASHFVNDTICIEQDSVEAFCLRMLRRKYYYYYYYYYYYCYCYCYYYYYIIIIIIIIIVIIIITSFMVRQIKDDDDDDDGCVSLSKQTHTYGTCKLKNYYLPER